MKPSLHSTVLRNATVVTRSGTAPAEIVVVGARISLLIREVSLGPLGSDADEHTTILDLDGRLVAPGLIDTQLNGGFGLDFTSEPESIWDVGALLPAMAVTAFLPTIVSSRPEIAERAMDTLANRPSDYLGAEPLGLHIEGPILNPERAGVHDRRALVPPSLDLIKGWGPESRVAMVTLAPELSGAYDVIRALADRGVVVAMGHSCATYSEAEDAARLGARHVTHLYNAMGPFNHRDPGLVGFSLDSGAVTAGLISDGVHCAPAAVRLALKSKGPAGIVLVSDAVAPMGQGDGQFDLAGLPVVCRDGVVTGPDGVLAGSAVSLLEGTRRFMRFTDCSLDEAVTVSATNPARLLRLPEKGAVHTGADADLVVFERDLTPALTMVGGRIAYRAPGLELDHFGSLDQSGGVPEWK